MGEDEYKHIEWAKCKERRYKAKSNNNPQQQEKQVVQQVVQPKIGKDNWRS